MGQTSSKPDSSPDCAPRTAATSSVSDSQLASHLGYGLSQIQGEVLRQKRTIQQIAGITYDEFLASIQELNEISSHFLDANGKQLVFAVKKGSDTTVLWKATVKVACVKIDAQTKNIDSYRPLNLKQFLQVYQALQSQTAAVNLGLDEAAEAEDSSEDSSDEPEGGARGPRPKRLPKVCFSPSKILKDLSESVDTSSLDECCICLERRPDVILPCAHSYCLPCIEQWNVDHKTCPVCRETLDSTDDSWVISDGPDSVEIATEIQKSLMELAHD